MTALTFPALADPARTKVHEEARITGHAAGYAEGLAAARLQLEHQLLSFASERDAERRQAAQRLAQQLTALNQAAAALHAKAAPTLDGIRGQVLAGALEIAETLLGQELSNSETSAQSALRRALSETGEVEVHTVRLHPEDLAVLGPDTAAQLAVTLRPDPTLKRGDAVAEYPHGFLDARLGAAIDRARAAILGGSQ